jgi:hypothetical protein
MKVGVTQSEPDRDRESDVVRLVGAPCRLEERI